MNAVKSLASILDKVHNFAMFPEFVQNSRECFVSPNVYFGFLVIFSRNVVPIIFVIGDDYLTEVILPRMIEL